MTGQKGTLSLMLPRETNKCYVISVVITGHAVLRKWVLLTDPDDKMAGVKVREMQSLPQSHELIAM